MLALPVLEGPLDREINEFAQCDELAFVCDQRQHDLDLGRNAVGGYLERGLDHRAHLHLVEPGQHQAQPGAASSEHRIRLFEFAGDVQSGPRVLYRTHHRRWLDLSELTLEARHLDELVDRRVQQPNR